MYRIGIIGALNEEIEKYSEVLEAGNPSTFAGFKFQSGCLKGRNVVIVKSGVGKVNAAICAQVLIDRFSVDMVIFTGVAGALNPSLDVTDVVISRDSLQHDMDGRGLGFSKGHIPYSELKYFTASDFLVSLASAAVKSIGLNAMEGRILSGDQFIIDKTISVSLREEFGGDCVDMESAAVAHTCTLNGIPHVIIRSMSDKADASAGVDFPALARAASENSFRIVEGILSDSRLDPLGDNLHILEKIKAKIRTVPDWPKRGIIFRDITTLLKDNDGFGAMVDLLTKKYGKERIDYVVGVESRGFIIGSALAHRLGVGFIPIRKKGKLPAKTISEEYELEYGKDRIEIHADALAPGDRVLLVDDLIATGGTALAACRLLDKLKADLVECCFIVDLPALGGKKRLGAAGYKSSCLVEFEGN